MKLPKYRSMKPYKVEVRNAATGDRIDERGQWHGSYVKSFVVLDTQVMFSDASRIYPKTEQYARNLEFVRNNVPEGTLSLASTTEDDRKGIVTVTRDVNPGTTFLFDLDARTVKKLYDLRPELPSDQLANMQAVRYTARDGQEIPAYLVTPKGLTPTNLPTVILPHGGPCPLL